MTRDLLLLRGQDKLMSTTLEQRISNTLTCSLTVNIENSPEFIYNAVVERIQSVLENLKHFLRARQHFDQYYFTQQKSKQLAEEIVHKSDKYLTHLELGEILVKSGFSAIVVIYQNFILIAATHVFVDGLHFAELIGTCLDNSIIDYSVIPKFNYVPFLTEASTLPGILGSVKSLTKRKLSVDSDWKTELMPLEKKKYSNKIGNVKQIKGYLNTKFNKFGYSATLAVISGIYTFENTTKNEINVGIAAAFINDTRFNNFSSFIIHLNRPANWCNISLVDKLNDVAKQIDYAINSYGKSSTVINYLITNVYNLNLYTNNFIDVLVSCAPTQKHCSFNGKDADLEQIEIYGTSLPLYLGFWTANSNVVTSVFSRSNELKLNNMNSLQIDEIMEEINANHKTDCR